jgi:hypothetical protein
MSRRRLRKKKRAQVILEVAILVIVLAILGVGALVLFSGTNLNMLERLDKYKQSRIQAVNSAAGINPVQLLDYSPHTSIVIPNAPNPLGDFFGGFLERRIDTGSLYLERSNDIITFLIPVNVRNINYYITPTYTYASVVKARDLARKTADVTAEAWGKFNQAINTFQDVLDHPTPNGPFDPALNSQGHHPEIAQNRQSLANTISSLRSAAGPLNTLLYGQLLPRLDNESTTSGGGPIIIIGSGEGRCYKCQTQNFKSPQMYHTWKIYAGIWQNLKYALECWYWRCKYHYGDDTSNCYDAPCKDERVQQARATLSEILQFSGSVQPTASLPASVKNSLSIAYSLAQAGDRKAVTQARDIIAGNLLNSALASSSSEAKRCLNEAYNALNQMIRYWDINSEEARYYTNHNLTIARAKLQVLYEAVF